MHGCMHGISLWMHGCDAELWLADWLLSLKNRQKARNVWLPASHLRAGCGKHANMARTAHADCSAAAIGWMGTEEISEWLQGGSCTQDLHA